MRHIKYYVPLVLSAVLFGCNGKRIDRVNNEAATQTKIEKNDSGLEGDQAFKANADNQVWTQSKTDLQNLLSQKNIDTLKLQSQLLSAEKILLHEKTLSDKNYYQSLAFRNLVMEYNRGIILLQEKDPASLEKSGLLKRYVAVLMEGCQKDQAECKHLLKFKVDHLGSQILTIHASNLDKNKISDSDLAGFYQILKAALDLQSTSRNATLENLYFKNSIQYLTFLRKSKDPQDKTNEQRLKSDLSMILTKLSGQFASSELTDNEKKNYCDFLQLIEPLSSVDKIQIVEDKRKKDLIKDYLVCQAGKSSLEESLVKSLKTEQEEQLKIYGEKIKSVDFAKAKGTQNFGYSTVLKALEKDKKLVKAFQLNLNHTQDAGIFIIDKLYYDMIDTNQAQQLMDSIKVKSDLELIKSIRAYTQNQTAHLINETLRLYSLIFERNFNEMGLKGNLFSEVINQVNAELFQPWYSHLRHLAEIEKLIQIQFDRKYRSGYGNAQDKQFIKTQQEILDLRSELSNIKNHLNLVLSTPMDYALHYYMSQVQGSVKFVYNFGATTISIDAKAEEILSQNIMPSIKGSRFRFFSIIPADNEKNQDNFPIVSLQYALKIGLFDKFPFHLTQKENKKSGLELFSAQFLKETIVSKRATMERNLKGLQDLKINREFKQQADDICKNPFDAKFNLSSIEAIRIGFITGDSTFQENLKKIYDSATTAFFGINQPNDTLYGVNQMKILFKDYLNSTQSPETNSIIKLFDEQFNYIQHIQKEMTLIMLDLDRYFVTAESNCLKKLTRIEYFRRVRLFEVNIEHYKNIHAAMTLLKIAKQNNLSDLGAIEKAAQSIDNQDVLGRVHRTIESLKKNNLYKVEGQAFNPNYLRLVDAVNNNYAIHNDPDLAEKYGYFVNEKNITNKDGVRINLKRVSIFDENSFIEGLWDATLRNKSLLGEVKINAQELSALLEKPMATSSYIGSRLSTPQTTGNDAELMGIWSNAKKTEIIYDVDQDKFIESAARMFGNNGGEGAVSWFTTHSLFDIMDLRLGWLIDISKAKPLIFSEIKDPACQIDGLNRVKKGVSLQNFKTAEAQNCGVIKVSARDLLNAFLDSREFFNTTPAERKMYELMGLTGKNGDRAIKAFKYSTEESTDEWTYFDEFIRRYYINNGSMNGGGDSPYLTDMFAFTEFKKRKEISLTAKDSLLGIDQLPITLMRESLRKGIFPQVEWVLKLEKEARKIEDEHKQKNFKLEDITIVKSIPRNNETLDNSWRVMRVKERTSGTRSGAPIYLRDVSLGQSSAIQWFRDYLETNVIENTNCEFLPQKGDSDQMTYKSDKCPERYKEWFHSFSSGL